MGDKGDFVLCVAMPANPRLEGGLEVVQYNGGTVMSLPIFCLPWSLSKFRGYKQLQVAACHSACMCLILLTCCLKSSLIKACDCSKNEIDIILT